VVGSGRWGVLLAFSVKNNVIFKTQINTDFRRLLKTPGYVVLIAEPGGGSNLC